MKSAVYTLNYSPNCRFKPPAHVDEEHFFGQGTVTVKSPAEAMALIEYVARDEFEFYRESREVDYDENDNPVNVTRREFRNVHDMTPGYSAFTFSEIFIGDKLYRVDFQKGFNLGAKTEIFIETKTDNVAEITEKDFSEEATFTMTATEAAKTVSRLAGNLRHLNEDFHEVTLSKPDSEVLWTRAFRGTNNGTTYNVEEVLNHPYGTLREVWIRNADLFNCAGIVTIKIDAEKDSSIEATVADFNLAAHDSEVAEEFNMTVDELKAAIADAKKTIADAEQKLYAAQDKLQALRDKCAAEIEADLKKFLDKRTITVARPDVEIREAVTAENLHVSGNYPGFSFRANGKLLNCDYYDFDSAEQITAVANEFKAAIACDRGEFTFPTVDEVNAWRNRIREEAKHEQDFEYRATFGEEPPKYFHELGDAVREQVHKIFATVGKELTA